MNGDLLLTRYFHRFLFHIEKFMPGICAAKKRVLLRALQQNAGK